MLKMLGGHHLAGALMRFVSSMGNQKRDIYTKKAPLNLAGEEKFSRSWRKNFPMGQGNAGVLSLVMAGLSEQLEPP